MRLILAILILLAGAGYYLVTAWYPDVAWLQEPFMRQTWPALAVAAALLGIAAARLLTRADPLFAAWSAFALAGCILLVPLIIARDQQAASDAAANARLRELRSELQLQFIRIAEELRAKEADRLQRAKTDRYALYEDRIPDDKLQAVRDLDARMRAEVESQADAYARALRDNPTRGPDFWLRIRTLDELELERSRHQVLYERTRAFTQFVESFRNRYTDAINSLQLAPPADRVAIAEMERILQDWDRARVLELRNLDVAILAAALNALDILRDEWGEWSYNPRDNAFSFTDPDRQAAFQAALERIQAAVSDLEAIRQRFPQPQ